MKKLSTTTERFEELIKNPLLFLHTVDHSYTTRDGRDIEDIRWEPLESEFHGELNFSEIQGNKLGYALVYAEGLLIPEDENSNKAEFYIHTVDPSKIEDWRRVIDSFILRSQNTNDKFPFIHLLWMLNFTKWEIDKFCEALAFYDAKSLPFVVNNALCRIGRCLSVYKQRMLEQALANFNYNYEIYNPSPIIEALDRITPKPEKGFAIWSLYAKIDYILENPRQDITRTIENDTTNPFLQLYRWLHNNEIGIDYNVLGSLYSIASHDIQMDIVKRYFHDVRNGRTQLETNILKEFRDNKFSEFIRYRYCLETPDEPINLSVALLCDCLLTLQETRGVSFQSFDGILDFAISRCDVTKPSINLGMEEFHPKCHGGATYNSYFEGFIDYSIVYELDESSFTEEHLRNSIRNILDRKRLRDHYYSCSQDENHNPLPKETLDHCIGKLQKEGSQLTKGFSCLTTCKYENKWLVFDTDYDWLNKFLKNPLPEIYDKSKAKQFSLDIEDTSTEVFEKYIRSLADFRDSAGDKKFVVHSSDLKFLSLLLEYSKPVSMRIMPINDAYIGNKFDVFGIRKEIEKNLPYSLPPEDIKKMFIEKESAEVHRRVIETLKSEFKQLTFNGEFFEAPYNQELLLKILGLYYFKVADPQKNDEERKRFLRTKDLRNFIPFCAPHTAEGHNKATGLPFFWCRGVECFFNNLNDQTLQYCSSWHGYSMYHMLEIMGYPKITTTEAGHEPDVTIRDFIACSNRVMKKFRRLKCRNCGHLMYTAKGSGFNRNNYYSCINPTCPEYSHEVYLSYCFKCKKGLIDSRDSAKCPNGWYICPTCLSCCNDDQYNRQAQRYVVQGRPVPKRIQDMLGQGHNDKGRYFCPKCGSELEYVKEEDRDFFWGCPECKEKYNLNSQND